jgi:plastocyanin
MKSLVLVAAALVCAPALGADHVVAQTGKSFSVKALNARIGDTLSFRNDDPFVHNIFSLSDAQSFDLGTFAKGEMRKVKMEKEGKVEIECAVHPEMKMIVDVAK